MKPLILLLICIPAFVYSQKNPCKFDEHTDQFNGLKVKESPVISLTTNVIPPTMKIKIARYVEDEDSVVVIGVFVTQPEYASRCFGSDCWIYFKSGDEVCKIPLDDDINCGSVLSSYARLEQEHIDFLRSRMIDAVRIGFTEGYEDFIKIKPSLINQIISCL